MTTLTEKVTAADLERMPDDGFRYELVRGELRRMPPTDNEHGRIAAALTGLLFQHVRAHRLGVVYAAETGFRLSSDPDTVRAPDAAFIRQERIDAAGPQRGFWPGAADLVVEVVSPSDNYRDVEEKVVDWSDAGGRMVVVVNPRQRRVIVHRSRTDIQALGEGDELDGGDVVPGWRLAIADLFS